MSRSSGEDNDNRQKRDKKLHGRRRWLKITLGVVGTLVVLVLTAGGVEYYRLQPLHHFASVPVISSPSNGGVENPQVATSTNTIAGQEPAKQGTDNSLQGSETSAKTGDDKQSMGTANPNTSVKGTFNVLLLGSDERSSGEPGHSDSIMIVHVDLTHHEYNMLSVPRDSRIYLKGFGYTKLTSVMYVEQARYGIKTGTQYAIDAISNLTGLSINYYAETNYWGLQDIVNAIDGISMNIPFSVTLTHPWYPEDKGKIIKTGDYELNGQMVTEVVHERYSLESGDYGRQQLQESALIGIAHKVLNNPTLAPKALREIHSYLIGTNMSSEDMISLALAIKSFSTDELHYYQTTGQSVVIYNDVLGSKDDEVLLNMNALQQIVQQHFG